MVENPKNFEIFGKIFKNWSYLEYFTYSLKMFFSRIVEETKLGDTSISVLAFEKNVKKFWRNEVGIQVKNATFVFNTGVAQVLTRKTDSEIFFSATLLFSLVSNGHNKKWILRQKTGFPDLF